MYVRAESCLTLCDPMDCSRLGSSVPGIFQAKHWCGLPFPPSGDTPDRLSGSKFHLILMIPPNAHCIPVFADDETDAQKSEPPEVPKGIYPTSSSEQMCTKSCLVTKPFHLKVYHFILWS